MVALKKKLLVFVPGLQKAGTTSIHEALKRSGRYGMPIDKELNHLFRRSEFSPDQINSLFSDGSSYAIVSPTAAISSVFLAGIESHFCTADTQVVLLNRNPVDRALSHIAMLIRRGDLELEIDCVRSRLLADYELSKCMTFDISLGLESFENIVINSNVNYYRDCLLRSGLFSDHQIKVLEVGSALKFFDLEEMDVRANSNDRFIKFDYRNSVRYLKKIPGTKRLFAAIPFSFRTKIFWYLQTKFSVAERSDIEELKSKLLSDPILEHIWLHMRKNI